MLFAVATKQGILLATITHYDIVPAFYLTCLLPQNTIYGIYQHHLKSWGGEGGLGTHLRDVLWLEGGARAPKPSPKYATQTSLKVWDSQHFHRDFP